MTVDIVSLGFIVGAIVLLVMLWRRGPEKRGAFFVTGLLVVGTAFALVFSEDALEQGLGDAYREEMPPSYASSADVAKRASAPG